MLTPASLHPAPSRLEAAQCTQVSIEWRMSGCQYTHGTHSQGGLSTTPGATPPRRRGGPTSSTAGPGLWSGGSGTTSTTTAAPDCRESRLLLVKLISISFYIATENVQNSKKIINVLYLFLVGLMLIASCIACLVNLTSKRKRQK